MLNPIGRFYIHNHKFLESKGTKLRKTFPIAADHMRYERKGKYCGEILHTTKWDIISIMIVIKMSVPPSRYVHVSLG